jgi:hypothetical protein
MHCVLRLWDVYLSTCDGFNLHPYVCLAVLSLTRETLEDLEQSDMRALLLKLPNLDVDQLVFFEF